MVRISDILDLVRAPAALTVVGDALAGAVAARGEARGRAIPLALSSASMYAAGMALNDYADAELDRTERPERPIPSGRVSRNAALGIGAALTGAGLAAAAASGRAHGKVALALAGCVWLYDLVAKPTRFGPVVMAACRGLDVLMGAAGTGWRRGLLPAGIVAAHTLALTTLSRGEVHGTSRGVAVGAAVVTVASAGASVAVAARTGRGGVAGALIGAAGYLAACLPGQLRAARTPDAAAARDATRAGIRGVVPLQTALVAGGGSAPGTALLCAVDLIGRALGARRTKGDLT